MKHHLLTALGTHYRPTHTKNKIYFYFLSGGGAGYSPENAKSFKTTSKPIGTSSNDNHGGQGTRPPKTNDCSDFSDGWGALVYNFGISR
jgi:hypothetical protein